ncbi:MAG: hypothetical protein RJA07_1157 [Bacteroidota bacterium]|jgi:uncharacterized protein with HEPN domain
MPKRDDDLLLGDMLEAAESIFLFVGDMNYETFIADKKTVDAVVRNFEILGEASKYISDKLKKENPLIEWREMSDFRNVLIHEYFGIDYEILWNAIQTILPQNHDLLKRLV